MNYSKTRAFTLIELLIVIAIIGLLSSVVLASLNTAREKARLAAVKEQMTQFRSALVLNYNPTSGHADLRSISAPGYALGTPPQYGVWLNTQSDCDYSYGPGSAAAIADPVGAGQVLPICQKLLNLINPSDNRSNYGILVGNSVAGVYDNTRYSINLWANNASNNIYCVGSSGVTFTAPAGNYTDPGCYYNP